MHTLLVSFSLQSLLPPIVAAAQEGKTNIVQFLLEKGADPSVGNPVCVGQWQY